MRSGQHKSSVHERIRRPSPVVVRERLGVTWAGDTPAEVEAIRPVANDALCCKESRPAEHSRVRPTRQLLYPPSSTTS